MQICFTMAKWQCSATLKDLLEQCKVSDLTFFLSGELQVHCFSKVADLAEELVIVAVLEVLLSRGCWFQLQLAISHRPSGESWEQTSWWWDPDASVSSWIYSTDLEYIKRESVPDIPVHGLPDSLAIYGRCCFNIPHASKPFHPRENTCGSSLILKTCESFDTCLNNASLWKV